MKKALTNQELITFCDQFAMILSAGISPLEGISILSENAGTKEGQAILKTVYETLEETGSLCQSLASAEVFPPYFIHMIEIGEISGHLDQVTEKLAAHYRREESISASIKGAVTYPLIMLGMMLAVVGVLIIKVMPIFQQVFQQMGLSMSGLSGFLLNLGENLHRFAFVFLILILLIAAAFFYFTWTVSGRGHFTRFLQKAAFSRKLFFQIEAGRFASSLSMLLESGIQPEESLSLIQKLCAHPLMRQKLEDLQQKLSQGEDFSDLLKKSGIFPGIYAHMIDVGFRTGSVQTALEKTSERCQETIDQKTQTLIGVLEPTLVAILCVIVGLILLSVMLPLMGMMSSMG